ncbi:hypothetical protein JHK85_002897 [Glycine max]|nr:hypothetical protein JHK85_002897 [Glycine max]
MVRYSGVLGVEEPHQSIPNLVVKLYCGDDTISSGDDGVGPVAQRIRARGYEPRCRGFESLLAHNRPKKGRIFPSGGRKIMIGLADPKLWNFPGLWNKGVSRTYTEISESIKSPQVGFEPTTSQLTADRSTTELLRNNGKFELIEFNSRSQPMTNMSSKFPS